MNLFTQLRPGIKTFLTGAFIAGIISAILNNLYAFIYTALTGFSIPDVIHVGSITGASVIPALAD